MSDNLAQEYADSMWQSITDNLENGTPFGEDMEAFENGETESPQELTAYDYLEDVLDIKYTVNSAREYCGARICIGWGGPNVWIDTNTNALEVYWGDTATRYLRSEFIDALDEALEELWNMGG